MSLRIAIVFAFVPVACGGPDATSSTDVDAADALVDIADGDAPDVIDTVPDAPETIDTLDTVDTDAAPDTPDTQAIDTPETTDAPDTVEVIDTLDTLDTNTPSETVDTVADVGDTADTFEPLDTSVGDVADALDTTAEPADTAPADTTVPEAPPGVLAYERVDNIALLDDLQRVAWHTGGDFALVAGRGGKLAVWKPGHNLTPAGTVGDDIVDLVARPDGDFFVLDAGDGLVRVAVDLAGPTLSVVDTVALPTGSARAAAFDTDTGRLAIAAHGTDSIAYLYTYSDSDGLSPVKGFNAGAGIADLMWGRRALYAGSYNVITAHGHNGADSKTWVLASDTVVANNWSPGFGNAGGAAWRPAGDYGIVCGWSSNKLYVFDGAWEMATLPVPTGASPNAVAWKADGTRALVVGRVIGAPAYAVVIEHRPGDAIAFGAAFVDQSIRAFADAPWFGNTSSMHLLDVAWRPGACDEGLIVGTDSGPAFAPTFGYAIRFYDTNDPLCAAKPD